MIEAFAMQKLLIFFQQKYWHIWEINFWKFNETLTNDAVSVEQPGPEMQHSFQKFDLYMILYFSFRLRHIILLVWNDYLLLSFSIPVYLFEPEVPVETKFMNFLLGTRKRRRGRMVRAARLWRRKSP